MQSIFMLVCTTGYVYFDCARVSGSGRKNRRNLPFGCGSLNPSHPVMAHLPVSKETECALRGFEHGKPAAIGMEKWRACLPSVFAESKSLAQYTSLREDCATVPLDCQEKAVCRVLFSVHAPDETGQFNAVNSVFFRVVCWSLNGDISDCT